MRNGLDLLDKEATGLLLVLDKGMKETIRHQEQICPVTHDTPCPGTGLHCQGPGEASLYAGQTTTFDQMDLSLEITTKRSRA